MESIIKKKTLGRRKIEIKKIENKTSLQVAFAKRRRGLFRKASELAVLCGAEVAILVQSPSQKMFAFGHPSVGALLDRFSPSPAAAGQVVPRRCGDEEGRRKLEEAEIMLEMEKRRAAESGGGFWWEESVDGLELHELEEYLKGLEDLEGNVYEKLNAFETEKIQDFCTSSSVQDFCTSSPVQDLEGNVYERLNEFENVKKMPTPSIEDFCNSSWTQGFGDDSWANPYSLMIENGYGLDFQDY